MVPEEAELLRRAQEGDDGAFARLAKPCLDPAYRLALRLLGDPQEAEDAVQDALYKAWRALPHFRGEAKFSTWLYRIVWRVSTDRLRRPASLPLDAELKDVSEDYDPESQWEGIEAQREVERALSRLSAPYRAVLTLYYVEDLPVREIAAILQLPVGTVKTHLHRARQALKRALAAQEGGEGG